MSVFYEYCVNCGKMFTDPDKWLAHKQEHGNRRKSVQNKSRKNEAEDRVKAEAAQVPGGDGVGDGVDQRIAKVRMVNAKRKKLIAAGIEAATMPPDEVDKRYADEKKKGRVK